MKYHHLLLPFVFVSIMAGTLVSAKAATVREIIRTCSDDGKKYCEGVRYGKPMQTCLASNHIKLTPACKSLVDRLEAGEKVTLF